MTSLRNLASSRRKELVGDREFGPFHPVQEALLSDLNTPEALGRCFRLIRELGEAFERGEYEGKEEALNEVRRGFQATCDAFGFYCGTQGGEYRGGTCGNPKPWLNGAGKPSRTKTGAWRINCVTSWSPKVGRSRTARKVLISFPWFDEGPVCPSVISCPNRLICLNPL